MADAGTPTASAGINKLVQAGRPLLPSRVKFVGQIDDEPPLEVFAILKELLVRNDLLPPGRFHLRELAAINGDVGFRASPERDSSIGMLEWRQDERQREDDQQCADY